MTTATQTPTLGHDEIDIHHQQFMDAVQACNQAGKAGFPAALKALVEHTEKHFAAEEALMEKYQYNGTGDHHGEHKRVLAELNNFLSRIEKGGSSMLARGYVKEKLPEWFALHTSTMDSALVLHISQSPASA